MKRFFLILIAGCAAACSSGGDDCPDGECYPPDCPDRDCPAGSVCADGACVQEVCLGIKCPDGTGCAGGECYPKDCTAQNCPGLGEVCVDEECIQASCVGVDCDPGQRCAHGSCYPIDCQSEKCPGPGDVCIGEQCVERTCLGVTCPSGQACAGGYCYPEDCDQKICSLEGMLCINGECQDPRCAGVFCRGGRICSGGWCQEPGCGAQTCPDGCCDASGCRQSSYSTCGTGGVTCVDCTLYDERVDACPAGACICTAAGAACQSGEVCTGSECCTPESDDVFCGRLGYECDPVTDVDNCGVSRTADCGTCTAPDVCTNNQCDCDEITCLEAGAECDWILDGCGYLIYCGDCTPPETCNTSTNTCECESHATSACYLDDRYWYDSCGNLEEIREACDYKCENDACIPCEICTRYDQTCTELTGGCTSECLSECQTNGDIHNGSMCTEWVLADDCGAQGLCCDDFFGCGACR